MSVSPQKIIQKYLLNKQYNKSDDALLEYLKTNVKGYFPSYATSLHDELFPPNQRLIELSLAAIKSAFKDINLEPISQLFSKEEAEYINTWPGEHYRLLSAFIKVLQPKIVIEIGTATGASCLCMKKYLQTSAKIVTFDIIQWKQYPGTGLKETDFDNRLEQKVEDLTIKENALLHSDLFKNVDFIFVDAIKDGYTEEIFCDFFETVIPQVIKKLHKPFEK